MLFRQLYDCKSSTYTYFIADGFGSEAAIIDPVANKMPLYLKLLEEWDLKLVYTIETHTHADHITGSGKLHEHTHCAIAMADQAAATCVNLRLKDGEKIKVGKNTLTAMYTPGHTDDHMSYLLDDRVFTGDCLLIRATGRTDFQSGDPYASYDSIFNKLFKLSDETLVYPAHDYKGMLVSTIGEEKRHNPRLQVKNADEYADIMNNLNLAKPVMLDIAVPANQQCGMVREDLYLPEDNSTQC